MCRGTRANRGYKHGARSTAARPTDEQRGLHTYTQARTDCIKDTCKRTKSKTAQMTPSDAWPTVHERRARRPSAGANMLGRPTAAAQRRPPAAELPGPLARVSGGTPSPVAGLSCHHTAATPSLVFRQTPAEGAHMYPCEGVRGSAPFSPQVTRPPLPRLYRPHNPPHHACSRSQRSRSCRRLDKSCCRAAALVFSTRPTGYLITSWPLFVR